MAKKTEAEKAAEAEAEAKAKAEAEAEAKAKAEAEAAAKAEKTYGYSVELYGFKKTEFREASTPEAAWDLFTAHFGIIRSDHQPKIQPITDPPEE